jgi:hypothetical protein
VDDGELHVLAEARADRAEPPDLEDAAIPAQPQQNM